MKRFIAILALCNALMPIQAIEHVVQPLDTLFGLSLKYNVPVEYIRRANNLKGENIMQGIVLKIPSEQSLDITVQSGDTLSELAYKLDVSEEEIVAYNRLESTELFIGQKIRIPPPVPAGKHRVLPGQTLLGISLKYGTTIQQLKAYNDLTNEIIYPNQILTIKPSRPEGYRVSKGDSLWTIAKNFNITIDQLKSWNKIDADQSILPGQVIALYPYLTHINTISESQIKPKTALASLQRRSPKTSKLPRFGEYFYTKPRKEYQPNTSYWEESNANPAIDYQRATHILNEFQNKTKAMPKLSNSLQGWHIVLDSGHGGLDPGAIVSVKDGNGKKIVITEDEYVYDITMRVYQILMRHGAIVDLTILAPDHHIRDGENARITFVNQKNEVYADLNHNKNKAWRPVGTQWGLEMRKNIAAGFFQKTRRSIKPQHTLFVSIHADNSKDFPQGTAVLYYGADAAEMQKSKSFAKVMSAHMGSGAFAKDQAIRILSGNPANAAILVEVRNIYYTGNAWALRNKNLRQQDSEMIARGILSWAGSHP